MPNNSLLKDFLQDELCLVVEPSQVFSGGILTCLQSLGVSPGQTMIIRRFQEAKQIVDERRPKLIIIEYEVDGFFGLELAEMQEKQYEENERIAIITTKNSSASAIAEAAEGQIDSYILKPFAVEAFKHKLLDILAKKLNPSSYSKKLIAGKALFNQGHIDGAIEEYLAAKKLTDKPALACFYAGQCFQGKGDLKKALAEYREGRSHQPLHYKCLIGEFEVLMSEKNYDEAYELVGAIAENYPITPKRLGQMFVAAVFTRHFEKLEGFYEIFRQLDQRTPELAQISSMAVLTAGKYFIRAGNLSRASEHFEMAILIGNRDYSVIEKIVTEFIQVRAADRAEYFLTKVNVEDTITPAFKRLAFRVDEILLSREQIVEKGRQLVLAGHGTPDVFELVVRSMAEAGKETLAESIISKALETHPDMRQPLYKILEDHLPRKKQGSVEPTQKE